MRRRHRPPPRVPLPRRAVVWFPPAAITQAIEAFRTAHDPLAASLPAHVTLVFPFESTLTALQVATHVKRVVARWPQLPLRLEGAEALLGQWVNLRVTQGRAAVVELHDRLYRGVLAPFLRSELAFDPHLTLGRVADAADAVALAAAARALLAQPVDATLDALSVCTLASDARLVHRRDIALG